MNNLKKPSNVAGAEFWNNAVDKTIDEIIEKVEQLSETAQFMAKPELEYACARFVQLLEEMKEIE